VELINQTSLLARVDTSELTPGEPRLGLLTAKATYAFDLNGKVELETQEPLPLLNGDEYTPLGILPADFETARPNAFEVIVLGQAHAAGGQPVESLTVELAVGDYRRQLQVSGDRVWVATGPNAGVISRAAPFVSMPLVYERAFGGTQVAWLDPTTEFDLFEPINPRGRGFDAEAWAKGLGETLKAPAGYPRIDNYRRYLPNLEDPKHRILAWNDTPEPACWATVPPDAPLYAARQARAAGPIHARQVPDPLAGDEPIVVDPSQPIYRCHPDWVIQIPKSAPYVRLTRLCAKEEHLAFRLPDQRVVADYTIQGRTGSRALLPQRLVILPEQLRMTLLFRMAFTFGFDAADERSFRLRLEPGWFPAPPPS